MKKMLKNFFNFLVECGCFIVLVATGMVSTLLTPVMIILGIISPKIFKKIMCGKNKNNRYIDLLLGNMFTYTVLSALADNGKLPIKSLIIWGETFPELLTKKAIEKSVKGFSSVVINKLSQNNKVCFEIEDFRKAYLLYGERVNLPTDIIKLLVKEAYIKNMPQELDKILEKQEELYKKVKSLSVDLRSKLLIMTGLSEVEWAILDMPEREILGSLLNTKKEYLLEEILSVAPGKKLVWNILSSYNYYPEMEKYVRILIRQHGLSPNVVSSYMVSCGSENRRETLLDSLKEREDRVVISQGAEALKKLLKERNLTIYGQSLLIKKDVFEVYYNYLLNTGDLVRININAMKEIICNGEKDLVIFIERNLNDRIKKFKEIEAVLIARKSI
ncbi:MAG: hypothetical protein IKC10_00820 [Alphaproteobacteria bacterium]|nr:hypothetical protein [Alphaproteobacteria bacterium]